MPGTCGISIAFLAMLLRQTPQAPDVSPKNLVSKYKCVIIVLVCAICAMFTMFTSTYVTLLGLRV